jgi:MYXO-CTERM domain-containing protein
MKNRSAFAAIAIAAVSGGISAASADIVVTFTYDDLAGSFTSTGAGTGNFSAVAGNDSAGEVSRIDGNPGSASFGVGFVNGLDASDFTLNLSVAVVIPNLLASGVGTFTSTDADGDTITGSIAGDFIFDTVNGFIFFNGALSNVFVNDNGALDDSFDGSQLGSFQISGLGTAPFEGALTQITFGASSFFTQNFENAATGLTGQILPTPGALALLGMGGLVVGRRRR